MISVEDIILARDRRGIAAVRSFLPSDFCARAARLALEHVGTALIITGFYILEAGKPENDGPPGAIAIGRALTWLGYKVYYVTDEISLRVMQGLTGDHGSVVTFPVCDAQASERYSRKLLDRLRPSLLVSIERCGPNRDGKYLNMRGQDISQYTAKLDTLFHYHDVTIGIGDGGNEIGMGNAAAIIPTIAGLPRTPCLTTVTELIVATVSNWGGYGLVAALSRLSGIDLLPSVDEELATMRRTLACGAVDGICGTRMESVDGFSFRDNSLVVSRLRRLLDLGGVSGFAAKSKLLP